MARSSRSAASLFVAIIFAVLVSVMGTVQHQTRMQGDVPIGLIFSLGLVLMAAAMIRDRSRSRAPGFTFALGLAILIFVFSQDISGDVMIPANDIGLYWSYGSISLAALVAMWPKLST